MKKIIHMRFVSGMYPWFFSPSKNDVIYRQVKVVHLFMQCSDFNWFRTHRLKVNAAWKFQCMCALLLYCVDDFFSPPVESAWYWIKNKQGNGIIANIPSLSTKTIFHSFSNVLSSANFHAETIVLWSLVKVRIHQCFYQSCCREAGKEIFDSHLKHVHASLRHLAACTFACIAAYIILNHKKQKPISERL